MASLRNLRHAEQLADHHDRQRLGQQPHQVRGPGLRGQLVEQPVHQLPSEQKQATCGLLPRKSRRRVPHPARNTDTDSEPCESCGASVVL